MTKPTNCEKCGSSAIEMRKKTFASVVSCHVGWACMACDQWAVIGWIPHRDIENIADIPEIKPYEDRGKIDLFGGQP